ncbi:MAG: glycosyltransferase family 4 protein [Candidatus Sumerlaeaceae bacterium]
MSSRVKPRHVLIIVENLPVPFDRRVWLEAQALRDAGYGVSVICPKMKGYTISREMLDGIEIYRHPLPYEADRHALGFLVEYGLAFMWELFLTWKIFLTRGIDIIHACNPPDNIFLVALTLRPFGVKFVFDQHDINPELYIAKYGRTGPLYHVLLWLERMTFRTAHMVISTNESYKEIAMRRGGKTADDVHVVRSAPNMESFRSVRADVSLKRGREYLVVYLGVMGKQEGVDLLLQSVDCIVRERGRTDISFTLVGSGPERAALENLAARMQLGDFVEFTGRIPDDALLRYLSTADVCVNPDRVNEMNDKSTMNKIMEYMAVGKPIVQFEMKEGRYSAEGSSLYAKPNDAVDFAEKILELLNDANTRLRMGDFGRKRMEEALDWRFSKAALTDAYTGLLSPNNSAGAALPPRH